MDYGKLIRDAWAITWRYRFLWLLGLLAGGSAGLPGLNSGGGGGGRTEGAPAVPDDLERLNPALAAAARAFSSWATANVGLLIAIAAIVTLVLVALLVLSFIAQGGIAEATVDLAEGRTSSLGRAWSAGLHLFWRYVGLWLVLVVGAILVAAAIAAVAATAFVVSTITQLPGFGIAIAAAATIAMIGLVLLLSIVVAFAQRAIAVENVGPIAALRSGWSLMRAHLGDSLMTWLINVGLTLACAVACLAGVVGLLVVIGGIGAVVYAFAGFTAPTIAYMGVGSIVFIAIALTIIGIVNAFFWTYWSLAYLRLSGRLA